VAVLQSNRDKNFSLVINAIVDEVKRIAGSAGTSAAKY
jgi:hypothetical protein